MPGDGHVRRALIDRLVEPNREALFRGCASKCALKPKMAPKDERTLRDAATILRRHDAELANKLLDRVVQISQ